jgi:uncharacterized protein YycO
MSMKKADGTTLAVKGLSITADGSIVAFSSGEKLVAADTNNLLDVYLWHRGTKAIELASKKGDGTAAGIVSFGAISGDGTYVAYIASGANFPACGFQTYYDIYRQNVQSGEIQCVSGGVDDTDYEVFRGFQMSADGSMFAFSGILEGIQPKFTNVYLVNLSQGTTPTIVFDKVTLESLNFHRLTADGTKVLYSNGIYTDPNNLRKFCTYVIATATHSCTTRPEGTQDGDMTAISPTGRFSVISSWDHSWIGSVADNLKPNGDRSPDLFIWDREGVNNAISGKLTGDDGTTGLENVILTNGSREKYVTDASGNYTMPYLTAGQSYVITPTLSGKTFYPASKQVAAPSGNVDFGTHQKFTISGRVTDKDGKGFANVEIKTTFASFVTDANGYYRVDGLAPGTYAIAPVIRGYAFEPSQRLLTVSENLTNIDFAEQCVSPNTGFNRCILEVGDILLHRGEDFSDRDYVAAHIYIGTYWWHSAIYVGDNQIAHAVGAVSNSVDEVKVDYVTEERWWVHLKSSDWVVIRPNTDASSKLKAANYAVYLANRSDPLVRYNTQNSEFYDRDSESPTYCNKFVWQAYLQAGLDLETEFGLWGGTFNKKIVTADDLYFSTKVTTEGVPAKSTVVNDKNSGDVRKLVFYLMSPADIVLVDNLGRKTGHDPVTGITFNEIPDTLYTGPDSHPESISVQASANTTFTLQVVGTDVGTYTLAVSDLSASSVFTQSTVSETVVGQLDQYIVPNAINITDDLIEEVPSEVLPDDRIYLPLVQR